MQWKWLRVSHGVKECYGIYPRPLGRLECYEDDFSPYPQGILS